MKFPILILSALALLATSVYGQTEAQVNASDAIVQRANPWRGQPPISIMSRALLDATGRPIVYGSTNQLDLIFPGATTNDGFNTTLRLTEPTAARTITIPNSSGTLLLTAVDDWVFEGVTADAHETTVSATDPTGDGTIWLPDTAVGLADANLSFFVSSINSGGNAPGLTTAVWGGANSIVFEGTTADASEAVLDVADPTGDTIFRLPVVAAGTYSLFTSTLATNALDVANSVTGASNALVWEGSTADASEITLDAADATADVIYRLPTAAAGTYGVMSTSLAANQIDIAASVTGTSNGFVAEGATADAFETTLAFADATADATQTIPATAASGTVIVHSSAQAEAATDTLTAAQLYGGLITNASAGGAVVYTLPAPVVGMQFTVVLTDAQDVDINPADGTQILTLTNATGDAVSSASAIGNFITLRAISTTQWIAVESSGTWTDAN